MRRNQIPGRWSRLVLLWAVAVASAWAIATYSATQDVPVVAGQQNPATAIDALTTWDAGRYAEIATEGYVTPAQYGSRFILFPLFPAIIALVGAATGVRLGAILVSQVLTLTCIMLMSWMMHREKKAPLLQEPGLWMLANPYGFFFLAGYAESLFMLLSLLSWHAWRSRRTTASFAAGVLTGLARPTAIVLPILLGVEALYQRHRRIPWLTTAALALAPAAGVAVYAFGYVAFETGSIDGFLVMSRRWWGHEPVVPFQPFAEKLILIARELAAGSLPEFAVVIAAFSTATVLVIIVSRWRTIPVSWLAYVAAGLLLIHSHSPATATGRYEAVLFPVYFALAGSVFVRTRWSYLVLPVLAAAWVKALFYFTLFRWIA